MFDWYNDFFYVLNILIFLVYVYIILPSADIGKYFRFAIVCEII